MEVSKVTIEQVSREWLSMKRLIVKQSTYAKYDSIVRRHILTELGKVPLYRVNSSMINDYAGRKLGTPGEILKGERMSPKTVRDICTILKSIIRYGEKEYQMNGLVGNIVLPKVIIKNKDVLELNELKKIEKYLWENQSTPRCAGILLCLYTGIRLGEVCALKWEDIDLNRHILAISHTTQRITIPEDGKEHIRKTMVITDHPKSNSSERIIPIPDAIYPLIRELYSSAGNGSYFLTNTSRGIEPRNYQYFFKKVLRIVGIRKVNFHILRHTFASRCVEIGMDIKTLSEILGHANTNITLNYYVHSSLEMKRRQINRLKYERLPD
ncbi:MAG TPA: site-specific integrase [Candidatus Blautia excrementipullorum]|nr:site-specific integrase [Candidatus Blautia excrementipullorum]